MSNNQFEMEEYLERVRAVKDKASDSLWTKPNVSGLGVGFKIRNGVLTDEVCIRVYVNKKVPMAALGVDDVIPPEVEGISTDVIETELTIQAPIEDFRRFHNPLVGGISIINSTLGIAAGTLGCSVYDNITGEGMLLSNWHVICGRLDCAVGEPITQPGTLDGGTTSQIVARLHRAVLSERVDAAIGRITGSRFLLTETFDIGLITDTTAARLGMEVRKAGRTTGITTGMITDLDAEVDVGGYPGGTMRFRNQLVIENGLTSQRGDSGSVWVDNQQRAVGLLFAGNGAGRTIVNPIGFVMNDLNINFRSGLPLHDSIAITQSILNG